MFIQVYSVGLAEGRRSRPVTSPEGAGFESAPESESCISTNLQQPFQSARGEGRTRRGVLGPPAVSLCLKKRLARPGRKTSTCVFPYCSGEHQLSRSAFLSSDAAPFPRTGRGSDKPPESSQQPLRVPKPHSPRRA